MKKMELKQECRFDPRDLESLNKLQMDMNTILHKCKDKNLDSNMYIKEVYNYLEKRPNIKNNLDNRSTLDVFARKMAMTHLKSQTLHKILIGQEKDPKILEDFKEEIENFKKWNKNVKEKASQLSIEPYKTGGKIYNSLDKQINETNDIINNMVKQTNMAQA